MRKALVILTMGLSVLVSGCPHTVTASTQASSVVGTLSGVILTPDGKPAPGVKVTAYPVPTNLTTVAPLTQQAALTQQGAYRIADLGMLGQVVTDASGAFAFPNLQGAVNIEADLTNDLKVFEGNLNASKDKPTNVGSLKLQPTGEVKGSVSSLDTAGVSDFSDVVVFIPGTSYEAHCDASGAYTISNVPAGTFPVIATQRDLGRGEAVSVTVSPHQTTDTPLDMLKTPPAITQVTPDNAGPGATVTITGSSFGYSKGSQLAVTFNGSIATNVNRTDDGTIQAVVPAGATNGDVVVSVAGNLSNGQAFTVIKQITLPSAKQDLRLGNSFAGTASAIDTSDRPVPNPSITWACVSGDGLTVKGSTVTAIKDGVDALQAASGNVSATETVNVFQVTGVSLTSNALSLNAPPPSGQPDTGYVTSGTLSATVTCSDGVLRGVTWGSSDLSRVTVSNGLVQTVPNAPKGTALVTATPVDDPTFSATASVSVTLFGNILLEVQ